VAATIMAQAAKQNARVIVMATRAPGAVGRAVAGSVADRVVRESPCPVMLVPPGAAFMGGKTVKIARVLVPQDGSLLAFQCLDFLIGLPKALALEYVLIEVVDAEANRAAAETRLKITADWLRSRGARSVEVLVGHETNPVAGIIGAVREALPEVIAMSTRGSSGLERVILGSVAEGVIRESELPVLLVTGKVLAGNRPGNA
jgi:nucleotide-binding universal stress UspA family protein